MLRPGTLASLIAVALLLVACGVKGPPLPPVPATPQQSDHAQVRLTEPTASPTPSQHQ